MLINQINNVNFGYHSPLKTAWLKGELSSVKRGLYGEILTPKNVSLEHLTPVSHGGKTSLNNLVLADKKKNQERGVEPIERFVTFENIREYLKQFKGLKCKRFDVKAYVQGIRDYFKNVVEAD